MIKPTFNAKKTAQAAALLLQWNGGDMDKYLFIKMLYLADRKAFAKWSDSITGDSPVSMKFGPVLSAVYDLTKGAYPIGRADWEGYISDSDDQTNSISLLADPGTSELSKAEITILSEVFEEFKSYSWRDMRDFSHTLTEYEETAAGSRPIAIESILVAVGKSAEEIEAAEACFKSVKMAEALFNG